MTDISLTFPDGSKRPSKRGITGIELAAPISKSPAKKPVAMVVDGKLVHVGTAGVRDVSTNAPVTADTLFRIASMTKSFTAMAILNREYFRMVLLAHRRPLDVLRTDIFYVVLMVTGVFLATETSAPAVAAVFVLGLAAIASGRAFASRANHGQHILERNQ